jgi:hypothetical protein
VKIQTPNFAELNTLVDADERPISDDARDISRAHQILQTYEDVFRAVLRKYGPESIQEGIDLVESFVSEHLPRALRSFDEGTGDERGWLFVVFRNYAWRRNRKDKRRKMMLQELSCRAKQCCEKRDNFEHAIRSDAREVQNATEHLVEYLKHGNEAKLSRYLGISRYKTHAFLCKQLVETVKVFVKHKMLPANAADIAEAKLIEGHAWATISRRLGCTEEDAREAWHAIFDTLLINIQHK